MSIHNITWFAAAAVLALIIHFSSVLAIPYLSDKDAWNRLLEFAPQNQIRLISEKEQNNQLWAFHAPDIKHAVCKYDIRRGPVKVFFKLLRGFWSVALYDERGQNFYTADGYDLLRAQANLVLLGADDLKNDEIDGLPIVVPSEQGLVIIRAPIDGIFKEDKIIKILQQARCEQIRISDKE